MRKLISYLTLFCYMTITFADDCNNPLLSVFGFQGLSQPTTVSGLRYCKSLQSGQSCCSADTVNNVQDKATALALRLSQIVATRDRAIVDARDNVIPSLQGSLQTLKNNAQISIQNIQTMATQAFAGINITDFNLTGADFNETDFNLTGIDLGDGSMNFTFGDDEMTQFADSMQSLAEAVTNNLGGIKAAFNDFQKARTPCIIELLKLQSSAWCLACDPAYASKGVGDDGTVQLSDGVCRRVQSACFNFVSGAAIQSALLSVKSMSSMIGQVAISMQMIANNDATGFDNLANVFQDNSTNSTSDNLMPVAVPDGCTNGNCSWICTGMFNNGQIDETAATNGGPISDPMDLSSGTSRLLIQEEPKNVVKRKLLEKKGRILTASQWNPDEDESGVSVTFADDPANVDGSGSGSSAGIIQSGIMCLLMMLVALVL